jgi:hypothetical protein
MGFLQRIVKNESMKTDPPEIYGWRVFALACSGKTPSPAPSRGKRKSKQTVSLGLG